MRDWRAAFHLVFTWMIVIGLIKFDLFLSCMKLVDTEPPLLSKAKLLDSSDVLILCVCKG